MQIDVKIGRIGSEVDTTVIIGLFKEERLEESDAAVMESALHRYLRDVLAWEISRAKTRKSRCCIRSARRRRAV